MEHLKLFQNRKEIFLFFIVLISIFTINLYYLYKDYKNFIQNEYYNTTATILNIYDKNTYKILKLKTSNFISYSSTNKTNLKILDKVEVVLSTKNITFLKYIKGFYTKSIDIEKLNTPPTIKNKIYNYIDSQHIDKTISSLYETLFLATGIDKNLREFFSIFGISHLIAISGFHLGILVSFIYFLFNIFYTPLYKKYFPYRNKKFDIFIISSIILLFYLILIDISASFLRSYVMFILGVIFLRSNIKIISFETLLLVVALIIAFDPKMILSLSFWFSIIGVFYIFLSLQYSKSLSTIKQFIFLNIFVFIAITPIVHYFFPVTSIYQLLAVILTILFSIFYPIVLILHIFGFGGIFDNYLSDILQLSIPYKEYSTPFWFLIIYIITSLLSIKNKHIFILLNILATGYIILIYI